MRPILTTVDLLWGVQRPVAGYGVALALAILVGGALLLRAAHRARMDVGAVIAALGACVLGGFGGGYALSVVVSVASGAQGLGAAVRVGGLVFYGGLLGGVAGLCAMARVLSLPVGPLLDLCPVPLAAAHAIGRIGCFLGGCCYGAATELPWAVTFTDPLAPAAVQAIARHPVQLYESAALLLLALGFAWPGFPWPARRCGDRFALYVAVYALWRLSIETLRGDPERGQVLGLLSTSQLIALLTLAAALSWLRGGFVSTAAARYTGRVSQRTGTLLLLLSLTAVSAALWPASGTRAADPARRASLRAAARVTIAAGHFEMGSDAAAIDASVAVCALDPLLADACRAGMFSDELPRHRVHLDRYAIDRFEVDNASYGRCVSANACIPARAEDGDVRLGMPRQPVTGVALSQARSYCAFVGGKLPTEAQWERAARAGSPRLFPWGQHWNPSLANFGNAAGKPDPIDGYRYAAPVDAYPDGRSAYGLHNMAGNVWEWTSDRYGSDYYEQSPTVQPTGPDDGPAYVVRGGSWRSPPHTLRASQRQKLAPLEARPDVGFRCAYDLGAR